MSTKTPLTNYDLPFGVQTRRFYFGTLGEEGNELNCVSAICRSKWDLLIVFHSRTLSELLNLPLSLSLFFSFVKWDSHCQAAEENCCGDKIMNTMRYFATTKPRLYFLVLGQDKQ